MNLGVEDAVMLHQFSNDLDDFVKHLVHRTDCTLLHKQGATNCRIALKLFPVTGMWSCNLRFWKGINIEVDKNTTLLTVSGYDKQVVGQVAANIRALRPPEPYKGKGVRYVGEYVRQLEGKKAAKG